MQNQSLSLTESPNELTFDIDLASPLELVRILRQVDAQIYNGYLRYPGIVDEEILLRMEKVIETVQEILRDGGTVGDLLAGCEKLWREISRGCRLVLALFRFVDRGVQELRYVCKHSEADPSLSRVRAWRYCSATGM